MGEGDCEASITQSLKEPVKAVIENAELTPPTVIEALRDSVVPSVGPGVSAVMSYCGLVSGMALLATTLSGSK
jgi:hypothetical protein